MISPFNNIFLPFVFSKIEDVVKFPGLPQHKQLTYATKQLLAREVCHDFNFNLNVNSL